MSKFRVGQRVRIVSAMASENRRLIGKVGTVNRVIVCRDFDTFMERSGYGLDISPITHDGEAWLTWSDDQLEPVTDCYEVTSWDTGVWKPEHLRVEA